MLCTLVLWLEILQQGLRVLQVDGIKTLCAAVEIFAESAVDWIQYWRGRFPTLWQP
jgi:hypothetical protein